MPCPAPCKHLSTFRAVSLLGTLLATGSTLTGCSSVKSADHHLFGHTQPVNSPIGGTVVADEPQAALVGRDILARGGNAADAATATAFALSVTLPSRASLGGGGACLAVRPHAPAQAIVFLPVDGSGTGNRPASVPMMPRGFFLLQSLYGSVQFGDTLDPAIALSQQGTTVSQALASDLHVVGSSLLSDPAARTVFGKSDDTPLNVGDQLVQSRLSSFLSRLKLVGVGDLYNGALAQVFTDQANQAGGGLNKNDLRRSIPYTSKTLTLSSGPYQLSFLPPPADGGIGSAAAYSRGVSAQNAVSAWRRSMMSTVPQAQSFIMSGKTDPSGLPPLPASTSFVVSDQHGMAVGCVLSENNLFGTGRIAGATGVVLGAASRHYPRPLLTSALVQDQRGRLRAVLAASGQNDAAETVAQALRHITNGNTPVPNHGSGRLNSITCDGDPSSCKGNTDPRGNGMSAYISPR
ncbi:gamma-glutamyltranspeptidase [Saccharibacter sp. 17.LH.SD]|nr:gamma-glutamyltransferase [Saccharibacter sp. 17.LH.SD]MXV45077.1 gamma-glutamyltranspeptidase [Saccharibacter sp. 17.LH.SD]